MGLTVGVDIGGTKVAAGVVDEDGRVLEHARRSTPHTEPAAIAEAVASLVESLRERHAVEAVGIGAAGFIDAERATVLFAPNLIWRDEPLVERVGKLIDLPVVVENDANCHAWAETRFGAGRGQRDLVCAIIGTGIGGGIVLNGELYRGGFGIAAEMGHMRVVPDGRPCGCGNLGCWEQYASGTALAREGRRIAVEQPASVPHLLAAADGDLDAIGGPLIAAAAQAGDPGALQAFDIVGGWIGRGLADLASVLDPTCFVVGGGVSEAGDLIMRPVVAAFREGLSGSSYRPHAAVVLASLRGSAGMVGAADLARRR